MYIYFLLVIYNSNIRKRLFLNGRLVMSRIHLILEGGREVQLALLDLSPRDGQHGVGQTH